MKKGAQSTTAGELDPLFPEPGRGFVYGREGLRGDGGSWIVRAGSFLGLKPIAEARVLNLRAGRTSFGFEDVDGGEGHFSSSLAMVETERCVRRGSLEDFERGHHGLVGVCARAGGISRIEGKECVSESD